MKVIRKDKTYHKQKVDVQRSIDMAIERLKMRMLEYQEQNIEVGKIFGDDIIIHDIINKYFYVYKCRVNQMQIRLLYTMKDDRLIIISHWYKNRTNNDYIKYFEDVSNSYIKMGG